MEQKRIAVIWDWDYTLVDSAEVNYNISLVGAITYTKKTKADFPSLKNKETYLRALWSHPSWEEFWIKEIGLTQEQTDEHARNWSKYKIDPTLRPRFYEGIPQAVEALGRLKIPQAIVSYNTLDHIRIPLQDKGLLGYFPSIIDYDSALRFGLKHKPSPDTYLKLMEELHHPELVFCIGDAIADMNTAKALREHLTKNGSNTRVVSIWATYGLTPERIKLFRDNNLKADHTVKSPNEILPLIETEMKKKPEQEAESQSQVKKSRLPLPTRDECFLLWDEYKMPENIRRHTLQVDKIAGFLGKKLTEKGIKLNLELLDRAALLHDLDKVLTKNTNNHGELTKKILKERGYPMLGELSELHRFHHIHDKFLPWEAKVLLYADKRVKHDKITTIAERLHDFIVRYNINDENIDKEADEHFHRLEGELFSLMGLDPEKLEEYLR